MYRSRLASLFDYERAQERQTSTNDNKDRAGEVEIEIPQVLGHLIVAVHRRPLKIETAHLIVEFVRGDPPLFAGIAVKWLSMTVNGLIRRARSE